MSRPIGAYFHVPHGLSNAALLVSVVEFSIIGNTKRYGDIAEAMGERVEGLSSMKAAFKTLKAVQELIRDIKIPALDDLGVTEDKLEKVAGQMAEDAISSGSPGNNPRKASKK